LATRWDSSLVAAVLKVRTRIFSRGIPCVVKHKNKMKTEKVKDENLLKRDTLRGET
jgi:hypothetical protein